MIFLNAPFINDIFNGKPFTDKAFRAKKSLGLTSFLFDWQDFENNQSLEYFDKIVMNATATLYQQGTQAIPLQAIAKTITGKRASNELISKINESLSKLIDVTFQETRLAKKEKGNETKTVIYNLLQIEMQDKALLIKDFHAFKRSRDFIMIRTANPERLPMERKGLTQCCIEIFIMERIAKSKPQKALNGKKQIKQGIASLLQRFDIGNRNKPRYKSFIFQCLDHWKATGFIQSYEVDPSQIITINID